MFYVRGARKKPVLPGLVQSPASPHPGATMLCLLPLLALATASPVVVPVAQHHPLLYYPYYPVYYPAYPIVHRRVNKEVIRAG